MRSVIFLFSILQLSLAHAKTDIAWPKGVVPPITGPFYDSQNVPQGTNTQQSLQDSVACEIGASARLCIDSINCNCKAGDSANGKLPYDKSCEAPDQTSTSAGSNGIYQLGARPQLGGGGNGGATVNCAPNKRADCSGYASAVFCRAGVSFMPGQICKDQTTKAMISAVESGKSCFESIPGGGGKPDLKEGDAVIFSHGGAIGHIFLIDRVGENCDDFSISQSAKSSGIALTSVNAKSGGKSDGMAGAIKAAAAVNCGGKSNAKDKVKVVRFNPFKPGCRAAPKKYVNETACLAKCMVGKMTDRSQ